VRWTRYRFCDALCVCGRFRHVFFFGCSFVRCFTVLYCTVLYVRMYTLRRVIWTERNANATYDSLGVARHSGTARERERERGTVVGSSSKLIPYPDLVWHVPVYPHPSTTLPTDHQKRQARATCQFERHGHERRGRERCVVLCCAVLCSAVLCYAGGVVVLVHESTSPRAMH
jgi:hypothetical protein